MIFALVGNQNCGKTTLFNQLTGSNQRVGNFPGVTVDQKMGVIKGRKDCTVVDLPGIYSLRTYSTEEIVTRDFIFNERPDGIINIVDATNIERNLYLTLQLLQMRIPTVLALNMMDEVRGSGGTVDINGLSESLGIPVIPISAIKNDGIDELVQKAVDTAKNKVLPKLIDFCDDGPVHRCIHSVTHCVEDHARRINLSARFAAVKTIERDEDVINRLQISENELELIDHCILEMENETGLDCNAAIAAMRYDFIEKICAKNVKKPRESREQKRSERIDAVLMNKYLALPIFIGIMALIFYLTFDLVGAFLCDMLALGIDKLTLWVDGLLSAYGINAIIHSLIIDGIFSGVGSVLSFLPLIVVLFFFLSILEDTGYMARVAFVMDKLLRKIGLSGRSFVPMIIGFGCSVPAIMATRTLSSERDRKMTIVLTPFMSCSAKIPIYSVFVAAFFQNYKGLVMTGLYVLGMAIGVIVALIYNKTVFRGNPVPFVMEIPNYRLPSAKSVIMLMWEKAKDFVTKAFTVIFVATVVVWFLQTFDLRLNQALDSQNSILAKLGSLIAPIFAPLGFGDWKSATSLITGFIAKESVVSTLSVLHGFSDMEALSQGLSLIFSVPSAISFLVFTLLYTPCVAAIAAVKRELGSRLATVSVVLSQCCIAWLCSFVIYQLIEFII